MCLYVFGLIKENMKLSRSKGGIFQKVRFVFQISKSPKNPKNYPELEILNSRPKDNTVMGGNFEFEVQGSFLGYFSLEI